jgi:hypothetical protein
LRLWDQQQTLHSHAHIKRTEQAEPGINRKIKRSRQTNRQKRKRRQETELRQEQETKRRKQREGEIQEEGEGDNMEAAMDLMRRMPPGSTETALNALLSLLPDHSLDLLSQVDLPLQVRNRRLHQHLAC